MLQDGGKRQTKMWESHNLIWRKPADKVAGKRQNSQPVCAKLYIEVDYKKYEYTTTIGIPGYGARTCAG
jgi:hypothetical protein